MRRSFTIVISVTRWMSNGGFLNGVDYGVVLRDLWFHNRPQKKKEKREEEKRDSSMIAGTMQPIHLTLLFSN